MLLKAKQIDVLVFGFLGANDVSFKIPWWIFLSPSKTGHIENHI